MNRLGKSARKPKGDGYLRRAEILQAAEAIFVRDGYEGATIRKIADEVGLSSTALYMHFRDKNEILSEICEGAIASLLASNTEISARPIDSVSRVRMMMESYFQFGLKNPNAYRLVFSPTAALGRTQVGLELGARTYERFAAAVADIDREGRLRHGGGEVTAQVLWAACHGLVTLCISRPVVEWAPADSLIATMLDGLFTGLLKA